MGVAAARGAADRWAELRGNPPFGDLATNDGKAASDAELELRGWVAEGAEIMFNLYDASDRSAVWLSLGKSAGGLSVQAWDPARGTVTVMRQGRRLDLQLKQATAGLQPGAAAKGSQNPDEDPPVRPALDWNGPDMTGLAPENERQRMLRRQARAEVEANARQ